MREREKDRGDGERKERGMREQRERTKRVERRERGKKRERWNIIHIIEHQQLMMSGFSD